MYQDNKLISNLSYLQKLYTPSEFILIGTDIAEWITIATDFNISSVHYIDADKERIKQIQSNYDLPKNWSIHQALLHHSSEEIPFYTLSNSTFNGTVSHELLSNIWKNIYTIHSKEYSATTLNILFEQLKNKKLSKWLIIDCFQSLDILKGSSKLFNTIEVVIARTFNGSNSKLYMLNQQTLNTWMDKKGYKNIGFVEENHPEIGMSLFVKDYKTRFDKQQTLLEENKTTQQELNIFNQNIQKLEKENIELLKQLSKLQEMQEKFSTEVKVSKEKISALTAERELLLKDKEEYNLVKTHKDIQIDAELKKIETQIQFIKKFCDAK